MPKSYDPDEKMEVVLRVLKGEKVCDLADEYGVSRNSIYVWKNELLDGGMSKLSGESVTEQEAKLKEKTNKSKRWKNYWSTESPDGNP